MFKPPARLLWRQALQRQTFNLSFRHPSPLIRGARSIGTASRTTESSSWKSTFFRLGLAIGAVYYYNTSNVFAEEPVHRPTAPSHASNEIAGDDLETVRARPRQQRSAQSFDDEKQLKPATEPEPSVSAHEIEEEAESEGAFNPETGEINWDCPCLGGMAHGPCGDEFKVAFSCFVYSKAEVKGMDCIENFKHMQDCFRRHPDDYGDVLEEDGVQDGEVDLEGDEPEGTHAASRVSSGSPLAASSPSPMPSSTNMNATATVSAPAASPASEARSGLPPPAPVSHSYGHGATHVASIPATPSQEEKEARPGRGRTAEGEERKTGLESDSRELVPKAAPDAK